METSYRIGAVAKMFDTTLRTLRFWEESGILKPERHGTSRIYTQTELEVVRLALRLRTMMFSIKQMKHLISRYRSLSQHAFEVELKAAIIDHVPTLNSKRDSVVIAMKSARETMRQP